MANVILEKVVKQFGKVEVVHGVSLDIGSREFIVLVGLSGCGKIHHSGELVAGLEKSLPAFVPNRRSGGE